MNEITIESIRAELAQLDAVYAALPIYSQDVTKEQRERLEKAAYNLEIDLSKKLHLLLDTITVLEGELKS